MRLFQAAAVAAILLAGAAGQAVASDHANREASAEQLSTAGIDFRDAGQVHAFYKRLQQASMFVCGVSVGEDRARTAEARTCAEKSLREAVDGLNRPLLTATYQQSGAPMLARGY